MTTFTNGPCYWAPDSTDAENEIRKIFYQHWEKTRSQTLETYNVINKWRENTILEIQKYADQQINNLMNDFNHQLLTFDKILEQNLDTARACHSAQNLVVFNELRNASLSLEFQLAKLEYLNDKINCVKVITVEEQMERTKKERLGVSKPENNKLEQTLTTQPIDNIQENRSKNEDLPVNVVSPTSNQTQSHSSTIEVPNDTSRPIDNAKDLEAHIVKDGDSVNKCPICFMIFPSAMLDNDRAHHVNEHYSDS